MSQQNTVKFSTFGPNRGLSLFIGAYEFIDGICEVPERDVSSATSILTRYHDVCHISELEQKIAEYDATQQNREAAKSANPQPEMSKTPPKTPENPENPENPESGQTPPVTQSEKPEPKREIPKEPPAPGAGTSGEGDPESKKNGNGKKQPGKN